MLSQERYSKILSLLGAKGTASISEFLSIILCLFKPFSIPNMVNEVKIIGADKEENLI